MAKRISDDEKIAKKRNELRQLENQQLIAGLVGANKLQDFAAVYDAAEKLMAANKVEGFGE